jgi:hypothetical protein
VKTKTNAALRVSALASENWEGFYPILQQKLAPYFIGTDARDIEDTL